MMPRETEPRKVHLTYLEGIRGWAAVFVVLHHVWQFVIVRPDLGAPPRWFHAATVLKFGGYAVPVFIVLSGYCLMLPVTRSPDRALPGGLRTFAVRRARRILIPYYAALGAVLSLVALYPRLGRPTGTQWDRALPVIDLSGVSSHLLLVHNWSPDLEWRIDPPMWSVAFEWQIYFVFALVLLPLWRKVGPVVTTAVAFGIGLVPLVFGFRFASPWFVGLFAVGMSAACLNFGSRAQRVLRPHRWERFALVAASTTAILSFADVLPYPHVVPDTLVGLATGAFLVASTNRLQERQAPSAVAAICEWPISRRLGEFSYSLYLLHYPIVAVLYLPLADVGMGPVAAFFVLLATAVPASLAVAYAFHRVFERPFMRRLEAGVVQLGTRRIGASAALARD